MIPPCPFSDRSDQLPSIYSTHLPLELAVHCARCQASNTFSQFPDEAGCMFAARRVQQRTWWVLHTVLITSAMTYWQKSSLYMPRSVSFRRWIISYIMRTCTSIFRVQTRQLISLSPHLLDQTGNCKHRLNRRQDSRYGGHL